MAANFLALDHLGNVVADWVDHELMPRATTHAQVWVTTFVATRVSRSIGDWAKSHLPTLKMLSLVDESGRILIDETEAAALEAFAKAPSIEFYGVTFTKEDVASIAAIARRYAEA